MLDSVYIVQKRAIRIICDLPRRAHTAPYLKKLKLFSICDIYTLQVCQFMFKFMSNALPIQIFQINLNLILTFICITLVSAVICILIPLRLLRDLNPSVIMDRVYGTVCHMKLNLKKLFLHSQGNVNAYFFSYMFDTLI